MVEISLISLFAQPLLNLQPSLNILLSFCRSCCVEAVPLVAHQIDREAFSSALPSLHRVDCIPRVQGKHRSTSGCDGRDDEMIAAKSTNFSRLARFIIPEIGPISLPFAFDGILDSRVISLLDRELQRAGMFRSTPLTA